VHGRRPRLKDEVRGLAEELLGAEDRIDVLIANAGIGGGPRRESASSGMPTKIVYTTGKHAAPRVPCA
jgi:NAD(P)-dependent dehydrogenase (short-subunit alcohol dehydrogenase family)